MANGLSAQPLTPTGSFNWVYLVELLLCCVLTVFFLFYFNRLFATVVSYGIRAYTWHAYHAYIDIQALQISLLAGRIFFKDIRYHGHNQTILIHSGFITWQYWKRKVKDPEVFTAPPNGPSRTQSESSESDASGLGQRRRSLGRAEKGGAQPPKKLPCRISVKISGLEVFLYNRSPVYDSIVENIRNQQARAQAAGRDSSQSSQGTQAEGLEKSGEKDQSPAVKKEDYVLPASDARSLRPSSPPAFLGLFPIHLDCNKGAIAVGNENTKCVLTAHFERASGEFDAGQSGPMDVYRQLFNFEITHPIVHIKPNDDYKSTQLAMAARIKKEGQTDIPPEAPARQHKSPNASSWHVLRKLPFFNRSNVSITTHSQAPNSGRRFQIPPNSLPGQDRWQGLSRYLDENQQDEHEWDDVEYAKTSLIADCPKIYMSFFWDVPGPAGQPVDLGISEKFKSDINGAEPPGYGLDLQVFGGTINYGPWADRQRANLQSYFFPASYVDAVPAERLNPGQSRVYTIFKLYLSIEEDTVLRIPMREPSKDWKWKGKAQNTAGASGGSDDKDKGRGRSRKKSMWMRRRDKGLPAPTVRPFAWLDVKVLSDSTINYNMDMYARKDGYHNTVDLDVRGTEISSSVNHGMLWRSGRFAMDCDLSNPLRWNALRTWYFNMTCADLNMFILRDHLFLLTDLITDWGSGPPPDYFTFVPFRYALKVDFSNFKLYLNTNDSNIINNPTDLDDNNFVILGGEHLKADLSIPLDRFRPPHNEIPFDVRGQNVFLELCLPPKNTLHEHIQAKQVARLVDLSLVGSHTYYSETAPNLTDRLFFDVRGSKFSIILYGFLIRYLMKVKDNYFGEDLHFKTLEEYQGLQHASLAVDKPEANLQNNNKSNDLDVILCVTATECNALLPCHLYSARNGIKIDVPFANADLRFTNYYMDLMVNFSPISLSQGSIPSNISGLSDSTGHTEMFIKSLGVTGHRLFGLPPLEPTYVCIWDFAVGAITGECSDKFIDRLVSGGRGFGFSLDDDENALPILEPLIIHDATYLRLQTEMIHLWLHVGQEALLFSTDPITLSFNDLADHTFSQRMELVVPGIRVACVDARSASRNRIQDGRRHTVKTHAYLDTSIAMRMLRRKLDFTEERLKQQKHIQHEDQRTRRTDFLFFDNVSPGNTNGTGPNGPLDPPALIFPPMPRPLFAVASSRSYDSGSVDQSVSGFQLSPQGSLAGSVKINRTRSLNSNSSGSIRRSVSKARAKVPTFSTSRTTTDSKNPSGSVAGFENINNRFEDAAKSFRGLPPSSIALSSSLGTPYFPLQHIEPDLSDLDDMPVPTAEQSEVEEPLPPQEISTGYLDENLAHTSIIISAGPGIRTFLTPKALDAALVMLDKLQPRDPESLIDSVQISTMTHILDLQKRIEGKGKSTEVCLKIPSIHVRFLNGPSTQSHPGPSSPKDQYDLKVRNTTLLLRDKESPANPEPKTVLSLHTTVGAIDLSVRERQDGPSPIEVAVTTQIYDLLFWVSQSSVTSINVSMRGLDLAVSSNKMHYLSSLIRRTTVLATGLDKRISALNAEGERRLRFLAYKLTMFGVDIPDPQFLTRPSYALRAATGHLRNQDSWKIVSRFRYIYRSLTKTQRNELKQACNGTCSNYPETAQNEVLSTWDRWRSWDIAHVKKSLVMRHIFGDLGESVDEELSKALPLLLDVKVASLKLVIDPGPKKSELWVQLLTLNVDLRPPQAPSGLMLVPDQKPTKKTTVHVNTKSISVQLSWEISELAETLFQLFDEDLGQLGLEGSPTAESDAALTKEETPQPHEFQVIIVSQLARVGLDCMNVKLESMAQDLQLAVAGYDYLEPAKETFVSVLLHSNTAGSRMLSNGRQLVRTEVRGPSIYVSNNVKKGLDQGVDEWRIVGACQSVLVDVTEQILGFIDVFDAVLGGEVAYLNRQFQRISSQAKPKATKPSEKSETVLPNLSVALFMDSYLVRLAVLPPLMYNLSGRVGRLSVSPKFGQHKKSLHVDFDLDSHEHQFYLEKKEGRLAVSTLGLPPINGQLRVAQQDENVNFTAYTAIELITIDASALHGLLNTFNRPEISSVFHAIDEDITVVKAHFAELFPQSPTIESSPKLPTSENSLVYNIGVTMAGLRVIARTPGQSAGSAAANLALIVGGTQLKVSNVSPSNGEILPVPDITLDLRQIAVELTLINDEKVQNCGNISLRFALKATSEANGSKAPKRIYRASSSQTEVNIYADTASAVVDVINHLQDRLRDLDLSKEKKYLRRLRKTRSRKLLLEARENAAREEEEEEDLSSSGLFASAYALELLNVQVSWIVGTSVPTYSSREREDLVLSFRRIDLRTRKEDTAILMIEDMQLQMTPASADKSKRSLNSALLPEVILSVAYCSTKQDRSFAFQAGSKSLDVRVESGFILPAKTLEQSISLATKKFRSASSTWQKTPTSTGGERKTPFGNKKLASLVVDADFAGAVVHLQPSGASPNRTEPGPVRRPSEVHTPGVGRYGQFIGGGSATGTSLHAPGVALKVEYKDNANEPSLNGELKINASTNTLYPTIVPLILDISNSIKEVVQDKDEDAEVKQETKPVQKLLEEESLITADPSAILGRTRLNLGLRICRQEFSLSCQPIARVAATARFEDIYMTASSVKTTDHGHFFAISGAYEKLHVAVQHVYSRESTFSFEIESIILSLLNSKHLSGTSGISAILKVNPMKTQINARQLQDFLLFREIWIPPEIRQNTPSTTPAPSEPQEYLVQRYQQVASAAAFPWNATVSISEMKVELDLGQTIGKSSLIISRMWASSKKNSNWEQNLCIGVDTVGIRSNGRLSGLIELSGVKVRTSIQWPVRTPGTRQTPLIQASVGFDSLNLKTSFDYQVFAVADISGFEFIMYNVRGEREGVKDRLIAILDGDKIQFFCTATSASQGLALFQALERLVQENQAAYAQSLKDIERFLRRKSSVSSTTRLGSSQVLAPRKPAKDDFKAPISLHTDVVVTLRKIMIGVFPSSIADNQIFNVEASNAQARFAVALEDSKIHSALGLTLGHLSVALASVSHPKSSKQMEEYTIEEIASLGTTARGGTILRVPKVLATMQTWQTADSNHIEYIFKSSFEGKVDVGWNYSRIAFIRNMWGNHSRTLATRLGKPLPESAVKITAPESAAEKEGDREKITAVVNVPQSRYEYKALETPIIETPQLRDMGEATPPLEWIGLHRDRLPHVTHQIIIVTLLEVAKEVEDAYSRILGSS